LSDQDHIHEREDGQPLGLSLTQIVRSKISKFFIVWREISWEVFFWIFPPIFSVLVDLKHPKPDFPTAVSQKSLADYGEIKARRARTSRVLIKGFGFIALILVASGLVLGFISPGFATGALLPAGLFLLLLCQGGLYESRYTPLESRLDNWRD